MATYIRDIYSDNYGDDGDDGSLMDAIHELLDDGIHADQHADDCAFLHDDLLQISMADLSVTSLTDALEPPSVSRQTSAQYIDDLLMECDVAVDTNSVHPAPTVIIIDDDDDPVDWEQGQAPCTGMSKSKSNENGQGTRTIRSEADSSQHGNAINRLSDEDTTPSPELSVNMLNPLLDVLMSSKKKIINAEDEAALIFMDLIDGYAKDLVQMIKAGHRSSCIAAWKDWYTTIIAETLLDAGGRFLRRRNTNGKGRGYVVMPPRAIRKLIGNFLRRRLEPHATSEPAMTRDGQIVLQPVQDHFEGFWTRRGSCGAAGDANMMLRHSDAAWHSSASSSEVVRIDSRRHPFLHKDSFLGKLTPKQVEECWGRNRGLQSIAHGASSTSGRCCARP